MLPNHAPLVVAEQFALLEALHPGRIDLGIGRAPGTDPHTAAALRRAPDGARRPRTSRRHLIDLHRAARRRAGRGRAVPSGSPATPAPRPRPAIVLLGSSDFSRPAGRPARPAVRLRPPLRQPAHASRRSTSTARLHALRRLDQPYAIVTANTLVADGRRAGPPAGPARAADAAVDPHQPAAAGAHACEEAAVDPERAAPRRCRATRSSAARARGGRAAPAGRRHRRRRADGHRLHARGGRAGAQPGAPRPGLGPAGAERRAA